MTDERLRNSQLPRGTLVRHVATGEAGIVIDSHSARRPRGPGVVVALPSKPNELWEAGEFEVVEWPEE